MKITSRIILSGVVTVGVLTTVCFGATGRVNTAAIRIREEQNTSSNILTNIYEDDIVEIVSEEGDWYKIKYGSYTGYVKKEFITKTDNNKTSNTNTQTDNKAVENTNTTTNTNQNASEIANEVNKDSVSQYENEENKNESLLNTKVVLNQNVKIRLLPNFMSKQKEELKQGIEVTILEEMNKWIKITDGTSSGWIVKEKIINKTPSSVANPADIETTNTIAENTTSKNEAQKNTIVNETTNAVVTNEISNNAVTNNTVTENTNTAKNDNSTNTTTESTENKKGKINVETAKVREKGSSSATVAEFLDYGDVVTILAEEGDWYKITCKGITGYVNKRLVTVTDNVTSRSLTEERVSDTDTSEATNTIKTEVLEANPAVSSNGNSVVEYAKQYLGYSYISGGKSPETGFDCSGFTGYIFKHFGYTLGGSAASQTSVGKEVSREELQIGDLLLFYDNGKSKIGHTGIYMGNGDFIHAANPQRGVVTDNLNTNSYYNERYVTARRIVE